VNPALAGVALAVVLGAVVAVSARNARTAVLGLVLSLIGGAFLAEPLPDSTGLAARLIGTVLGGYLLWIAARGVDARTGGSRLGWPVELLIAAAAAVVGYGSHGLGAPALGPALAQAAGLGMVALAVAPILNGRDILRVGIGLILLTGGATLVRTALGGTPAALDQLVIAGLLAILGSVVATTATAARADGIGAFDLEPSAGERLRRPPDAHPAELR
jgi:hypothetical protein